ncbi:MAG TPA: ABC transporter permease [Terriglobales bacterium]
MSAFLQDLAFGFRLMRKSPLFYLVAVLLLALGIGANTAVFSVVDAVLLRKLPFRDPDALAMVWEKNPQLGALVGDRVPTSYTNFEEWVRQAKSFDGIAGFEDVSLNRTGNGEPERVAGARVSPNFFQVLGVNPAAGTTFDFVERDPSQSHAAMLSYAYWQSHFGGSRSIVGQTITLNDESYSVVGVLPANFYLPSTRQGSEQRKPDIWIPYDVSRKGTEAERNRRRMQVFARLRPGVTLQQSRDEMQTVARRLEEQNTALNAGFSANVFPVYVEDLGQELRRNLLVLLSAVGMVLLLACANLANLMLTRATARQRELAIRKALGASRARLIRQMLAECVLLSSIGGVLAIGVAYLGIKALLALKPADLQRPEQVHISLGVLLFTMTVSFAAGIVFGVIPALYVSKTDVNSVLKQSGASQRHPSRIRSALVVGEVGLAVVLLVGAVFMIRSLVSVLNVDPGFRPEHVLTMHFSLPPSHYANKDQMAAFCRQVLERVSALPGVKAASFSDGLPMTRIRMMKFTVDGQPAAKPGSEPTADMRGITSPDYFAAVGIPIVRGRNFTADEIDKHLLVIVVNQSLANKLWPNQDVVGKTIVAGARPPDPPLQLTVIGVMGDTHQVSLESGTRPEIVRPMVDYTFLTLTVRGAGDPALMTADIRNQVRGIDKDLPAYDIESMQEIVGQSLGQRRFNSFVMSIFGGLALVLAAVGIYGVLATSVEQRRQEIGIRMALGAQRGDVLRLIMLSGLLLVLIGVGLGIVVGFGLTRWLSSMLYGVSPSSLATYLAVSAAMIAIAMLACYLPAKRATKVDPMKALRAE